MKTERTNLHSPFTGVLVTSLVLFSLLACSPAPEPGSQAYYKSKVESLIDSIIAVPDTEWTDSLASWPADIVLPQIIASLKENPKLKSEVPRSELLGVLHRRRVVNTPEGRTVFLANLHEKPRAAYQSIIALQEAPDSARTEVISAIVPMLADADIFPSVRAEMLKFLNRVDPKNPQVTPIAEKFFSDHSQPEDIRTLSFVHVLNAKGADAAFALCTGLDTVGTRCAIYGFESIGGMTRGELNTTPEIRNQIRSWVLSQMLNDDKNVRTAAYRSLSGVYGAEYFPVIDGVYRLNPEIKKAIGRMAEIETDTAAAKRLRQELVLLEQQEKKQEDQKAGIVSPN